MSADDTPPLVADAADLFHGREIGAHLEHAAQMAVIAARVPLPAFETADVWELVTGTRIADTPLTEGHWERATDAQLLQLALLVRARAENFTAAAGQYEAVATALRHATEAVMLRGLFRSLAVRTDQLEQHARDRDAVDWLVSVSRPTPPTNPQAN